MIQGKRVTIMDSRELQKHCKRAKPYVLSIYAAYWCFISIGKNNSRIAVDKVGCYSYIEYRTKLPTDRIHDNVYQNFVIIPVIRRMRVFIASV